MRVLLHCVVGVFLCAVLAVAGEIEFVTTEAAPGVHVIRQKETMQYPVEGNVTLIVNDEDAIVIDSNRRPSTARQVIAEIRRLTDKPVRFLVNTHWHGDHHHGNNVYREEFPGVTIVGSAAAREEILGPGVSSLNRQIEFFENRKEWEQRLAEGVDAQGNPLSEVGRYRVRSFLDVSDDYLDDLRQVRIDPPDTTFAGSMEFVRGDRIIRLINNGPGNTQGDTIVFLPRERIVITGDLLVSTVPFMSGSFPTGWLARLEEIAGMDAETIIPGHGPVQHDRTYLNRHIALLRTILDHVRSSISGGLTLEETQEGLDLDSFRQAYAAGDHDLEMEFDSRVTFTVIRSAYEELSPK